MARVRRKPLSEVAAVVFSRDRALQLDAFLQSVRRHAPALVEQMSVIYRSTARDYARAYEVLRGEWSSVQWREEASFSADVAESLGERSFVVFHTDDDLYFGDVDSFSIAEQFACFSFRLGRNTTYCYPLDLDEEMSPVRSGRTWIAWRWRDHGPGAFGYPLALNGHVFRRADVHGWLARSEFRNPNELEVALQSFLEELPPLMASFRDSRLVNVPANLVNESFANRNAASHDIHELNARFLRGERIDLDAMSFTSVRAAHQEIPFAFAMH
jgi:hypothetical protein